LPSAKNLVITAESFTGAAPPFTAKIITSFVAALRVLFVVAISQWRGGGKNVAREQRKYVIALKAAVYKRNALLLCSPRLDEKE
jgi:hypothetical protein